MAGWRTAFQGFDVCDFVTLTITLFGFVAMMSAYLPPGEQASPPGAMCDAAPIGPDWLAC